MGLRSAHRDATGEGVTIALLDEGLDPSAPELRGADIRMMRSPCIGLDREFRPARAVPEHGKPAQHGTQVASLLVGNGVGSQGPGSGTMGMAPDATVLFYDLVADDGRKCDPTHIGPTLRAAGRRADVVSMSWGYDSDEVAAEARRIVEENEAVFVAAMPNADEPRVLSAPGALPGVVGVGSVSRASGLQKGGYAAYARGGSGYVKAHWFQPKFVAPGENLLLPNGLGLPSSADQRWNGTSYATPLVAGQVALVREKYPEATANQVIQHLLHHTTRSGSATEKLTWYSTGFGLPDTKALLAHDPRVWPDENPFLRGRKGIARRYPASTATEPAESAGQAAPSASAASATDDDASAGSGGQQHNTTAQEDGPDEAAGPGTYLALGAGLLAALGLIAALVLRRRRA